MFLEVFSLIDGNKFDGMPYFWSSLTFPHSNIKMATSQKKMEVGHALGVTIVMIIMGLDKLI